MEEKSCSIFAVAISFLVVSWITVALRCYVRLRLTRWGLDDIFVVIVVCMFTALAGCLMHSASLGLGRHDDDIKSLDEKIDAFKFFFTADMLYILSSGIVKVSFCLSLLRIVIVGRAYIFTIYTVGVITVIFMTFYFFFALFSCSPVDYTWEQMRGPHIKGTCRQYFKVVAGSYAHGSIICAGDLTLAAVPALMIRKLQLNPRTKISAIVLLGFGSVASIATIARLTYVHHGYNQDDFLYVNTEIMIWSMVEIGVSIIAISAVTLKPLLMKYKIFFSSSHDSNNAVAHDRGRIYGAGDGDFTYTIGSGPPRRNRQHRVSAHGIMSASRLRTDNGAAKGQSSSEENIWVSKGDGQTVPSRDGAEDDLELIPRGQIHKVVEFSASRETADGSSQHISEHRCTEQA
ncbi:hypothetical protein GX51_02594 [Blastomyces parvus]|uniref:Rhodopsin domain-containing protein n=1 Tax=Blastomyces parvus TaxID=2060905 RepID=A0A2B7XB48_9EURO|nr:hypothetical protein GX51_02594 [Blastomyces parvus]